MPGVVTIRSPRKRWAVPLVVGSVFIVLGAVTITYIKAATPFVSVQPELGNVSQAAVVADPSASGGKAVVFGKKLPAIGAFLGSDQTGVNAVPGFQTWLGGPEITVGRTYLAPNSWTDVQGNDWAINPWSAWVKAKPGRMLALNVPMMAPNESHTTNTALLSSQLQQGARGDFNAHYRILAQKLVAAGVPEATVILGWEMNGTGYDGRCNTNPTAWKQYWIQIVNTMRAVPGQKFIFNFNTTHTRDAIPFDQCWPGDQYVDEFGIDIYDWGFSSWSALQTSDRGPDQIAAFAAAHGNKPLSIPEWGLFSRGDNPAFVQGLYDWMKVNNVKWHTIADYCPAGFYRCTSNQLSSAKYKQLFGRTTYQ